jgi:hypothetical protein
MKKVLTSLIAGAVTGIATFGVVFVRTYFELRAHQPGVVPIDQATSFPPSAAWLFAAPWGVAAFAVGLVGAAVVQFARGRQSRKEA